MSRAFWYDVYDSNVNITYSPKKLSFQLINHIIFIVWDGITYPFPNTNGNGNAVQHFSGRVITYLCKDPN